MNHPRRRILAALLSCVTLVGAGAHAQGYPAKAVTLVVPYPPGGSADILARTIGQQLGTRLGQPVVVENKAGAGTAIGAKAVAGAAPDGYTLLLGTVSSQAINPSMNKVGYDPVKDFVAVSPLAAIPFVLVANPSFQAGSVADVIALAKTQPGKIAYASAGPGTSNHLAGELLASRAKIQLLHVPYKGSAPALVDVVGGQVPLMFDLLATSLPMLKAGKVKALAVTSRTRSSLLPDVPTVAESGVPDYEVSAWFGVFAPAGTPQAIVARLNSEITALLQAPDMQKRLRDLGADPETGTPEDYARYVREEYQKWGALVRQAGLAP
jgi:tripartite-type tricarboxylate transporter receptor subunit TctC